MSIVLTDREKKDVEFIRNVEAWPRWPELPVVGSRDRQKSGMIFAGDLCNVYHINIFDLGDRPGKTYKEKLDGVKYDRYASTEELVRYWTVD